MSQYLSFFNGTEIILGKNRNSSCQQHADFGTSLMQCMQWAIHMTTAGFVRAKQVGAFAKMYF